MNRKAFTLVELLVVIAIIGLLSTVAVVSLNSARAKARDTKRIADIKQIMTAMNLYLNENGHYPDTGALGCAQGYTWYCLGHGTSGTCWQGIYHGCTALDNALAPYMAKIPDDPTNDTAYAGDAYAYFYYNGGSPNPALSWGMDQATSATACLGGIYGQWNQAIGNSRYWCSTTIY
jgi:prepilin-type N-terminal cleavage/methylation domain-containing protein